MKPIGMLGGLGPESTLIYYQSIIRLFREKVDPNTYPEIILYSMDMARELAYLEAGQHDDLIRECAQALEGMRKAGAVFGFIASNTPHWFFSQIQDKVDMPLISIVEATVDAAQKSGVQRPGFLGTGFTMRNNFYPKAFSTRGMTLIVPEREIDWIHHKLMSEIEKGIILADTKKGFQNIVRAMQSEHGIDSLILGCTELPLILQPEDVTIPVLDTLQIHVQAIIEQMAGMKDA